MTASGCLPVSQRCRRRDQDACSSRERRQWTPIFRQRTVKSKSCRLERVEERRSKVHHLPLYSSFRLNRLRTLHSTVAASKTSVRRVNMCGTLMFSDLNPTYLLDSLLSDVVICERKRQKHMRPNVFAIWLSAHMN